MQAMSMKKNRERIKENQLEPNSQSKYLQYTIENDLNKVVVNTFGANESQGFHHSAFQPIKPMRYIDINSIKKEYSVDNPLNHNMMAYMNLQPHFPSASQVPSLNTISRLTQNPAPNQEPKKDVVKIVKLQNNQHPEVISDHNKRNPPK